MELLLNSQELLDLGENLRGLRIICLSGCCWVTQAGDSRDHILRGGGTLTANAGRRLIVTAMEPCRLALSQAQPPRRAGSLRGWFKTCTAGIQ